jgi:hypothetical protein
MNRLFLASVLTVLPFAGQAADLYGDYSFIQDNAPSQPAIVGHLDLGLGHVWSGTEFGGNEEFWLFEGFGRANVDFNGINLELETGGGADLKDDETSIGVAAHLWAALNSAAVGVFGGVSFPIDRTNYKLGVEGEAYLGAVTLGASYDYNWLEDGSTAEFWVARGWADVYPTQNFRIGGDFMYFLEPATSFDVYGGNLDAELRIPGTAFSGWVEGRYRRIDHLDADIWTAMIGFRIFMDAPGTTLQEHDRLVPWDNGIFDPFTFN